MSCLLLLTTDLNSIFREVELKILQLVDDIRKRKVAKFTTMMRSSKVVKGLLLVGGAAIFGALTGGVGFAASGGLLAYEVGLAGIATAVGGGAAAGAAVGGIGTAAALGTDGKAKKNKQQHDKKD